MGRVPSSAVYVIRDKRFSFSKNPVLPDFSFNRRASCVPEFARKPNIWTWPWLIYEVPKQNGETGRLSLQTYVEARPILTGLTSSQVFLEQADSQQAECWWSCALSSLLSVFPEDLSSLSKAAAEKKHWVKGRMIDRQAYSALEEII